MNLISEMDPFWYSAFPQWRICFSRQMDTFLRRQDLKQSSRKLHARYFEPSLTSSEHGSKLQVDGRVRHLISRRRCLQPQYSFVTEDNLTRMPVSYSVDHRTNRAGADPWSWDSKPSQGADSHGTMVKGGHWMAGSEASIRFELRLMLLGRHLVDW